jgi:hypothetical protein
MNRRRLRSAHDVERDRLMRVAAKAFHFEIAVTGVSASPSAGDGGAGPLEAEHALVPRIAGQPVGLLSGFRRPLCRRPDRCAVDGLA